MNSSLSNKRFENAIHMTNSIFPIIILPLATVGNFLCFLVFCRPKFQKRLTRTSSICLRLLCINDLILLYLFVIDVLMKSYMEPTRRIYSTPTTCRLYKFIRYSFLDMSAYLQLALATDRFICCVHHRYYSHWRKRLCIYYLLITALVLIVLKNSSFLSPSYGYAVKNNTSANVKCSADPHAKPFATYMAYGQSSIDVVFITCIPFFLIVYFNSRILKEAVHVRTECWSTITKLLRLKQRQDNQDSSSRINPSGLTCHRSRRRHLHLTFALGCISFIFILSTAPYKVFKVIERHDKLVRDLRKHGATKSIPIQLTEVVIDCLEYLSCSAPFFVCLATSIGTYCSLPTIPNLGACKRNVDNRTIEFICYSITNMSEFNFSDLSDSVLNDVENLRMISLESRGPLTVIPNNVCRLKQLKYLSLPYNQIRTIDVKASSPCLTQLETLDLQNNFIQDISISWLSQMYFLKFIDLSYNYLRAIPNTMFYDISHVENFNVSFNNLTTFELWLIQIKKTIDFSNNRITHFTNHYNVDLSNYESNITERIYLRNTQTKLYFDDNIFEMYNRCKEINSTSKRILMEAINKIQNDNGGVLNWTCSCQQYYLQEYVVSIVPSNYFPTWKCSLDSNLIYAQKCNFQSSFNFVNSKPRLCKIKDCSPDQYENFLSNACDLESVSLIIYDQLSKLNQSSTTMTIDIAKIVDQSNNKLNLLSSPKLTEKSQDNFQNIIHYIESYIESINTTININMNSISILSISKPSSIYSYAQINRNNGSLEYSTVLTNENTTASITINNATIANLAETDIYTFYFLPSSLFHYAQIDREKVIVSPIVGIHIPNRNVPHSINMSFQHIQQSSGRYSCEFWLYNRWNHTGCFYSADSKLNRHLCYCQHTTSFALIFIPHKTRSDGTLPSIVVTLLSIVCFSLSIFLSIRQQVKSFRHLSIVNIFTLLNSIVLFSLFTVILIRQDQQSSNTNTIVESQCSVLSKNLAIATYFFLVLTFASKALLGIGYLITIYFHFVFVKFTSVSYRWVSASLLLVVLISLIPTITMNVISSKSIDLFQQYHYTCWLNTAYIFLFISIPMLIFLGLNLLIVIAIAIHLVRFCIGRIQLQKKDKRTVASLMIWIALCISLGISWIVGPFLDLMIEDNYRSSSVIVEWIFSLFCGLEGLWILIINICFYVNQNIKAKSLSRRLNKAK